MSSKVGYLLEKLYDMDKKLGGKEHINDKKKNYDEFTGLKEIIVNLFFDIRKKIDQRQQYQGRTNDSIKLEFVIKEKMLDCNKNITKMNEYLKKNRSKDENMFEKRQKIYNSLHQQLKNMNDLLFKNENEMPSFDDSNSINDSMNANKEKLLGFQKRQKGSNRELTEQEKIQLRELEDGDRKQNELIDQLNNGVISLKAKAEQIGDSIQHTIMQCKQLEAEMTKTETTLINSNDKLKTIIKAYRSPSRCCLDFVLIIILIGLGVTIYYQLK